MSPQNPTNAAIASFEDLVAFLNEEGVPHISDPEHQRVEIASQIGELSGALMLLWGDDSNALIQCVHPLPFTVPEDRIPMIESAIARLNHVLDIAGFGFNHANHILYYRVTLPRRLPSKTVSPEDVRTLCRSTVKMAAQFYPKLKQVALEGFAPTAVVS